MTKKEFMTNHKIYLTPLSPIHIGCGEDFEPTNYVIDENVLYHFEPSLLSLTDNERQELMNYANSENLLKIQQFFLKHKENASEIAGYFADVASGIANEWTKRVGNVSQREANNQQVLARLAIERGAYLPAKNEPYIPGSSFKGALVTALLDQEFQAQPRKVTKNDHNKLLNEFLGTFQDSQLQSVKFSDFSPVNSANSKVYFSLNFKKQVKKSDGVGRGIPLRRECISAGQYRAFESELTLWQSKLSSRDISDYFAALNRYYLKAFDKECELLIARGLINPEWVKKIKSLLVNNQAALIRLGKSGADSKVYQGNNVAQIKIMLGKGIPPTYKSESTTVWLAANEQNQMTALMPFGWALIEADPKQENESLKQWCEVQTDKSTFNKVERKALRDQIIAENRAKQEAELEAKRAKAEAQRLAEQAEALRLEQAQSLALNQKAVFDLVEQYKSSKERQTDISSPLFKETKQLIEQAQNWQQEDRDYLLENINLDLIKTHIDLKKKNADKDFNKSLNKLRVEN